MPVEYGVKLVSHRGRPMGMWCHATTGIVARSGNPALLEPILRMWQGHNPHGVYQIEPIKI